MPPPGWKPGQSGNPNGRPKGTANRVLSEALKTILKVGEPNDELIKQLMPLIEVSRNPEHRDFIAAQRLIWSRLQAELRHEMDSSEVANVSVLLEALGITNPGDRGRSDDVEDAAE
jgi:hypothetical protein